MSEVAQVPQLRFPEFSGEWEEKRFDSLYPTVRNGFVGVATPYYVEEGVPYLQGKNIKSGAINRNGLVYINESFHQKSKKSQLRQNDIVMVQSGHVGECAVITEEFEDTNCHALLVSTPTHDIDSKFYINYFYSKFGRKKIYRITTGNTIKHILSSDLKIQTVSNPSYQEQQKIAAFLTAVDTKIEQLSKKQELLGEYKKGSMQQIFSQAIRFKADDGSEFPDWEDNTIDKALHSYKLGGNYSNSEAVTDYPLIKMGNLDRGNIKLNKLQYINTEENIDDSDKINYGDLFFNTRNTLDLVGKVAIWRDELPCAYYNSNLMKMEFSDNFFMNYRFNSFDGIKALRRVATGTTSVAAIYTKDLLKIKFSLPTLSEQQKIANFLSSIDTKIEQAGKQLDESKQFKKALLQQMFV